VRALPLRSCEQQLANLCVCLFDCLVCVSAGQLTAIVVWLSVSRIEGLGILRLHAFGSTPQLSMPMNSKYFFFLQNMGAYHLVSS